MDTVTAMEYDKILTVLKRYSFKDKMKYASEYSGKLINPSIRSDTSLLCEQILPWELECFVLLAVKANEWKADNLDNGLFIKIINGIREAEHPKLIQKADHNEFIKWFMPITSATQMDYQEFIWYKLYRYNFYFTYRNSTIDMKEEFNKKFGVYYSDVCRFALALWVLCSENKIHNKNDLLIKLIRKFQQTANLFLISREDYIAELDKITVSSFDYIYCLRPSYLFPFIRYDKEIYLPLPHLIIRAATSSLMYRLTDGNSKLRKTIGKEVLESYLLKIIGDSKKFDQIIGEQTYSVGTQTDQKTLDVMTRIGNDVICFDSKSYSPKSALRVFSDDAYDKELTRLGEAIVQVYKHIHDKIGVEYQYNLETTINKDRSNIWGFVVISENPLINMKSIYEEAKKQLHENMSIEEFEWLQGHVGLTSIYDLEDLLFACTDVLPVIQNNAITKQYNDYWLTSRRPLGSCQSIDSFKKQWISIVEEDLLSLI